MTDAQQKTLIAALHGIWILRGMACKLGVSVIEERAERLLSEMCAAFPGIALTQSH